MSAGPARASRIAALLAVWGPGLLVMLADTDAGNIVTAAQAGTRWGYRLLAVPLLLIPMLFVVQDLAARLGLFVGLGFGDLVRARFGRRWAWIAAAALVAATLGSLVTEFDGIAGVGEMYGVPRWLALPPAVVGLLAVVLRDAYRGVERIAIAIGLFELSFFLVAWQARPGVAEMLRDAARPALGDADYAWLGAALIGATFNPWMIFYQPAALLAKGLGPGNYRAARWDTATGAVVSQLVTAAVLVALAATLHASGARDLGTVGQISRALTPFLGGLTGRLVFGMGVVGASMVAAIVCSLAFLWGIAEVAGAPAARARLRAGYVAGVVTAALVVQEVPDLVTLSVAAQALNAVLMPVLVTLLIALAATVLPAPVRLRGAALWRAGGLCAVVAGAGVAGALAGLF